MIVGWSTHSSSDLQSQPAHIEHTPRNHGLVRVLQWFTCVFDRHKTGCSRLGGWDYKCVCICPRNFQFCLVNSQRSPPELVSQAPGGTSTQRGFQQHTWWFNHENGVLTNKLKDLTQICDWIQHCDLYEQQMWKGWSPNTLGLVGFHKVCLGLWSPFPRHLDWIHLNKTMQKKRYGGYLQSLGGQNPSLFSCPNVQ